MRKKPKKIIPFIALAVFLSLAGLTAQVDYDMFLGEHYGTIAFYQRQNSGSGSISYSLVSGGSNPLNDVDISLRAKICFVDIDNDGDMDFFTANSGGAIQHWKNTGTSTSPTFVEQTSSDNPLNLDLGSKVNIEFVDIDGDGDMDAFMGEDAAVINYYKNTGNSSSPTFVEQTGGDNPLDDVPSLSNLSPAFVDIDGDGDMDCFIGNRQPGDVDYFENTGTSTSAAFTERTGGDNPFNGVDHGARSHTSFVDMDGDGDQDAFYMDGTGCTQKYYKNTGTTTSPTFTLTEGSGNDPFDAWDWGNYCDGPAFVNIDSDALLNTVTISGNAGFRMMSSPVSGVIYSDLLSELWTQGMTGADVTDGTANVWTYDPAGSGTWNALSNLSTASLTAGQGLLVYVFVDTDTDGDDDVSSGVALTVNGTANGHLGTAVTRTTTASKYNLLGNPFVSTIDADQLFTDNGTTNWNSVVYVWNDAASDYYEWNGSTGNLSNGLIAPYQGFWVESKSGGTSYVFKSAARYSASVGTFYRIINGSGKFTVTNSTKSSDSFLSFNSNASIGIDDADAYKLMPPAASQRLVSMFYVNGHALSINNFPFEITEDIEIDFDVMMLDAVNDSFYTSVDDITMTWDLTSFPLSIDLFLYDMLTGEIMDVSEMEEFSFNTVEKGGFSAIPQNGIAPYPQIGSPRFKFMMTANTVGTENMSLPNKFTLNQNYPNPFNPFTILHYTLPEQAHVTITIYDMLGRHIKTLINQTQEAGYRSLIWDATNDYDKPVSAGIYLYQIQAGGYIQTKKMVLLK